MAEFMTIDLKGDKELELAFKNAERAFTPRVLMTAMGAGALLVVNEAKARAAYKVGILRKSIEQEPLPEQLAVKVGTNVPYAPRIEYGFVGVDSLGRRYSQPAQPYLRPALAMNREEINKTVRAAIIQQLRKAF